MECQPDAWIDRNLVEICGRVAIDPEIEMCDGGSRRMRMLVTTSTGQPRTRIDVLPVIVWDPADELTDGTFVTGTRVRIRGRMQRHVWEVPEGLRSRLEVVALEVEQRRPRFPL